jgi:hypothetical protein
MTSHITKTWFEDGKLITQVFEEKDIYKREWVGLTEEEIKPCWYEACQTNLELTSQLVVYFAKAIEAKLKEKNT